QSPTRRAAFRAEPPSLKLIDEEWKAPSSSWADPLYQKGPQAAAGPPGHTVGFLHSPGSASAMYSSSKSYARAPAYQAPWLNRRGQQSRRLQSTKIASAISASPVSAGTSPRRRTSCRTQVSIG